MNIPFIFVSVGRTAAMTAVDSVPIWNQQMIWFECTRHWSTAYTRGRL